MANKKEESHDFYQEIETIPIEDYETVAENKTAHPFNQNIGPQGTFSLVEESFDPKSKFHYVEREVHGRSIDEKATSAKVVWGNKILFGARDIKGARHENLIIDVKENQDGYNLIRVKGLYDETEVEYLVRASEYLLSIGIPTEQITAIYKPNEIIYKGEPIPINEWKKLAKDGYARRIFKSGKSGVSIQKVNDFIDTTDFYQVERELQVSERIRDLARCTTEEEFRRVLEGPLKWINVATKIRGEGIIPGTEQPEPFDINNKEDVQRFLEIWLPGQMGVYLGKLKKAGLKNDFGHAQQWSLAASMYDSQSFSGEPLDGQKLTIKDHLDSLKQALGVLEELFNPDPPNYVKQKFGHCLDMAKEILLSRYFGEINIKQDPELNEYIYENIANNSFFNGKEEQIRILDPEIYMKGFKRYGAKFSPERKKEIYAYNLKLKNRVEEYQKKQALEVHQ